MSFNARSAWSTSSLQRSSSCDALPKEFSRQLSIVSHRRAPESLFFSCGSRLRRSSVDSSSSDFWTLQHNPTINMNSSGSHGCWNSEGVFSMNAKETMMVLNDRLAAYLEKVAVLEKENEQLENNIKEWYEKYVPQQLPDNSKYHKTIDDLQKEISKVGLENAAVLLHTDNARLAGEDLENKYNMELCLRQNIETDVVALRRGLEILTVERGDLEFQLSRLTEDQEEMTKNHTEEVNILKAQLGARVNVEMDVTPSVDLKETLDSIRNEYENLMEKNIKEMETWFTKQSEDLNYEMVTESEQLQSAKNELIELRHTAQNLEIDLQTQMNMKSALEGTLAETEKTYCSELAEIQEMVNKIEADLAQLRVDMECQNIEYKVLMDVKSRLEYEISTYRRLLEGEEKQLTETFPETFPKRPRQGLKVVSITEELEDGRVISKYEKVHHLPYKHQPK